MTRIEEYEDNPSITMHLTGSYDKEDAMEVCLHEVAEDNCDVFVSVVSDRQETCIFLTKDDAVALARFILEKYDA